MGFKVQRNGETKRAESDIVHFVEGAPIPMVVHAVEEASRQSGIPKATTIPRTESRLALNSRLILASYKSESCKSANKLTTEMALLRCNFNAKSVQSHNTQAITVKDRMPDVYRSAPYIQNFDR